MRFETRSAALAILLEKSSAARQIEASGNARALEKRNQARDVHRQGVHAYQAGDETKAVRLLHEASLVMFEAVRLSAPEQVTLPKQQADFHLRLESVKALLAAQKRISAEKSATPSGAESTATIEALMREAIQLAAAGKLEPARAALDQAYLTARGAIRSMRDGETLVRSLSFASKEEEYRYEIDRNDSHQMLVKVLLEEKRNAPGIGQTLKDLLYKPAQLRAQATAAAARRDYASAVRLLEEATAELLRAMRGAGINIPG